ncbi:DNA mismatch repair protein MutS2 [Tumebacillus sp. BK434]|uniref:endonuclease MutS2 n=1 Tax=Tumebacillus sp. BK434 TaxID=2512169 RepID=UPI0010503621|nr:endonuclease MutS2 [Tumebacillus sp. BK434]TCP53673.1 DNA mismatch repair protein MutS2 [Tumebacillus sp. BK434]
MNERVLRVLEYDKIRDAVVRLASSSLGKARAEELYPSSDLAEVESWQQLTEEGVTVYRLRGLIPLGGIHDIRSSVRRAALGGILDAHEMLDTADTIMAGRRLKKFLQDTNEEQAMPGMMSLAELLPELKQLEDDIRQVVDDNGAVRDTASSDLRRIRSEMRTQQARIKEKLESIIRTPSYQKMLQDPIITQRNDRYCVPVKVEYRGSFDGIVHDQSASGSTLYIEPASVVRLANALRELQIKEEREVQRILQELSALVGQHAAELQDGQEALAELDFIFAKTTYARELRAVRPQMNDQGIVRVKRARHPLIDPSVVVPSDLRLGEDFILLVITGPNTGGKTVTLKTFGLLTLMAMSGLHVPTDDDSVLSTFDEVFADIGDEQSIEQSLSTFSSHMTNIVQILEKVDFRSLVLFDELGAGTDPTEGAALAMSILDFLKERGVRTVATTHYSELKGYAYNEPNAINASVEFDVQSLRPTYRLLIGVPGRSNAFAISERLGLRREIIEHAQSRLTTEDVAVDELIRKLEQNQVIANQEREQAETLRRELDELMEEFEKEKEAFYQQKDRMMERAEAEARKAVQKAEQEAAEIVEELRRIAAEERGQIKEHRLIELRKELEGKAPKLKREAKKPKAQPADRPLQSGDHVSVVHLGQKGHILEIKGNQVLIQIGMIKTKVKKDQLELLAPEKEPTRTIVGRKQVEAKHVSMELDLRGANVEEGIYAIDKKIDDALLAGLGTLHLIHGKGTGALRTGVQEYLRTHRQVKSYRYGVEGEGGNGVTVVTLK